MTPFQIAGSGVLLLFCLRTLQKLRKEKTPFYAATTWIALYAVAGLAIWNPQVPHYAAHALGIGRGADLVFYSAILVSLFTFFSFYMRFRQVESNLTAVVRELALTNAILEKQLEPARQED